MSRFTGKTVLVTGASSGIGEELARVFAEQGAKVAIAARREERLQKLAHEIASGGAEVLPLKCDVTSEESLAEVVQAIISRWGQLDVVVANAGFGVVGSVDNLTIEDYQRQFETNIYGVLRTLKIALPQLRISKGRIAVVGSVNGFIALPGNSAYAMSKFAVRALCDSLYFELKNYGVSVTHLAPGFVVSEIRRVDNQGVFKEKHQDRIPHWLQMPARRAAKIMVSAIYRRKRERVITGHGNIGVWLSRYFSWLVPIVISTFRISARPEAAES